MLLVTAMAVGCPGDDESPDAPVAVDAVDADVDSPDAAPADLTCAEIAGQLRALAPTASRACQSPSDCMNVGYPQRDDGSPTCNCGVAFLLECPGIAVNTAAWVNDPAIDPLYQEWNARCLTDSTAPGGACDCAPAPGGLDCVAQQCTIAQFNCFPVDAGP